MQTPIAADIISAVEFDYDGLHLATGDRGGRVVLFERVAHAQVGLSCCTVHALNNCIVICACINILTALHVCACAAEGTWQ